MERRRLSPRASPTRARNSSTRRCGCRGRAGERRLLRPPRTPRPSSPSRRPPTPRPQLPSPAAARRSRPRPPPAALRPEPSSRSLTHRRIRPAAVAGLKQLGKHMRAGEQVRRRPGRRVQQSDIRAVRHRLPAEDDPHPPRPALHVQDMLGCVWVEVERPGRRSTERPTALGQTHPRHVTGLLVTIPMKPPTSRDLQVTSRMRRPTPGRMVPDASYWRRSGAETCTRMLVGSTPCRRPLRPGTLSIRSSHALGVICLLSTTSSGGWSANSA